MGEARRRKQQQAAMAAAIETGALVEVMDDSIGEVRLCRRAPSVKTMISETAELIRRDESGERPTAKVPCNGCTACCHYTKIDVDPAHERPEDLRHLDLIPDPDAEVPGRMLLRKRADGACIHLGPSGCTVYSHRPRPCRMYDCRFGAVAGLYENYGGTGAHHGPLWVADQSTVEDRGHVLALQLAAHEWAAKHSGGALVVNEATEYAYKKLHTMLPILQKITSLIDGLSPAERAKTQAELEPMRAKLIRERAEVQRRHGKPAA